MAEAPKFRRVAMLLELEHRIDPEQVLDPSERRRQAEEALRERGREMGRRSGESRRRTALLKEPTAVLTLAEKGAA